MGKGGDDDDDDDDVNVYSEEWNLFVAVGAMIRTCSNNLARSGSDEGLRVTSKRGKKIS